jgi:hypothetical protein
MGDFWEYLKTILFGLQTKLCGGPCDLKILYQLLVVGLIFLGMFLLKGPIRRGMARLLGDILPGEKHHLPQVRAKLADVAAPLAAAVLLGIITLLAKHEQWGHQLIYAAEDLLWAWVIIRFLTGLLITPVWAKPFALLIMAVAAMDIVGVLAPTIAALDRIGFYLGEGRLSLWVIIKTAVMLALLLPLTGWL